MGVDIKLHGVKQVNDILNGLPRQLAGQAIRSVHTTGANLKVKKAMPTKFKKNMRVAKKQRSKTDILVGLTTDGFIYRFLEYGTGPRKKKSGAKTGILNPRPQFEKLVVKKVGGLIKYYNKEYSELFARFIEKKSARLKLKK